MIRLLEKREKLILNITLAIAAFAISYNFLILPIRIKNDYLNKEINLTKGKLKRYFWLLGQKKYLENKYSKFTSYISGAVEEQGAQVSSLAQLENLAKNANIRIIDLRPESSTKGLPLKQEIIITVKTEGKIEDYLKLFYELENSLFLFTIKKFQIASKENAPILEGTFFISQFSNRE